MKKGKRIKIELANGEIISAVVEYHQGHYVTVKAADGYIYEVSPEKDDDTNAHRVAV